MHDISSTITASGLGDAKTKENLEQNSLSYRLVYALNCKGLSQSELARRIHIDPPVQPQTIQYLCSHNAKRSRLIPYIAEALEVNVEWLTTGEGAMWASEQSVNHTTRLPLLTWEQLPQWLGFLESDQVAPGEPTHWSISDIEMSAKSYALQVNSDAMAPRFEEGTIIFIDPACQPQHKDFVIVYLHADQSVVFRRLLVDNGIYYLVSEHPVYKPLQLETGGYQFCGVVKQARINYTRSP